MSRLNISALELGRNSSCSLIRDLEGLYCVQTVGSYGDAMVGSYGDAKISTVTM